MTTKNFVVASDTIPYVLERGRLVEGDLSKFTESGGKEAVVFMEPMSMLRLAVRTAMRHKLDAQSQFAFTYSFPDGSKGSGTGERHTDSIRFGCTSFHGNEYRKLRKWALAK